jgi:septum formation protein
MRLLTQLGLNVRAVPCDLPEEFDVHRPPGTNAKELALRKAEAVAADVTEAIVIGADTIVVLDGAMLGKPADRNDAIRMLTMLSGRTHTVITGFALLDRPSGRHVEAAEETRVSFRLIPPEEIQTYVEGGSPMDKAGAYGIQDDYGAVFVNRIEGCFYNVVGLPLSRLYTTLREFERQLQTK